MEAIRKIVETSESEILVDLPESLRGKKIEIIILPLLDDNNKNDLIENLFNQPIHLKNFISWNREEIYEERIR